MSVSDYHDVPMMIRSSATNSERRVTPAWSISHFKAKMEPITGIPPTCQVLSLNIEGQVPVTIEAADEDTTAIGRWHLQPYAEIYVTDSRPKGMANLNLTETLAVPRYAMSEETYEALPSSVLAWKKAHKLGRFDPDAPQAEQAKIQRMWDELEARQIKVNMRCCLGSNSARRGTVAFVGEVDEIPGLKGPWVGVALDEPTGRNDGTVNGKTYFNCGVNKGVFVRPDRVEIGDFPVLGDELDKDLEEI